MASMQHQTKGIGKARQQDLLCVSVGVGVELEDGGRGFGIEPVYSSVART